MSTPFFTPALDGIKEVEQLMRSQAGNDHHPDLRAALEHLLLAGGKRVRPTIVFLVGNLLDAPHEKLVILGAAVEMLHTATLVHDDLIDGSLLRRGIPTLNARWSPAATVLTGTLAFPDRAGGNLSRPYFPDGEVGRPNGPFSRPIAQFNPFSTGLQSALIIGNIGQHVGFLQNKNADTPARCTTLPDVAPGQNRLQNGIQIFPGSVPIYRGNQLVGGIGVSGDGIDQDDMISFLGAHNGGARFSGPSAIGNAPKDIRTDTVVVTLADNTKVRLRYVSCPFAPFLDTADQNVCDGL